MLKSIWGAASSIGTAVQYTTDMASAASNLIGAAEEKKTFKGDIITCIFQYTLYPFQPENTTIAIDYENNTFKYQPPTRTRCVERWWNEESRDDISEILDIMLNGLKLFPPKKILHEIDPDEKNLLKREEIVSEETNVENSNVAFYYHNDFWTNIWLHVLDSIIALQKHYKVETDKIPSYYLSEDGPKPDIFTIEALTTWDRNNEKNTKPSRKNVAKSLHHAYMTILEAIFSENPTLSSQKKKNSFTDKYKESLTERELLMYCEQLNILKVNDSTEKSDPDIKKTALEDCENICKKRLKIHKKYRETVEIETYI